MADPAPKPPRHLKAATRRWWVAVTTEWELDEHHRRLLTLACEAWDECQAARQRINREGLTVAAKSGPRQHPCYAIARDSRIAFARLLRELDLDAEPARSASRPPALRSVR